MPEYSLDCLICAIFARQRPEELCCAVVLRRAHISGSKTFLSLNSRLDSNEEEQNRRQAPWGSLLSTRPASSLTKTLCGRTCAARIRVSFTHYAPWFRFGGHRTAGWSGGERERARGEIERRERAARERQQVTSPSTNTRASDDLRARNIL